MDFLNTLKRSGTHCFGFFASVWVTFGLRKKKSLLEVFTLSSVHMCVTKLRFCSVHWMLPCCRCTWTARSSVCYRGKVGGQSGCHQDCSSQHDKTVLLLSFCGGSPSTSWRSVSLCGPPKRHDCAYSSWTVGPGLFIATFNPKIM